MSAANGLARVVIGIPTFNRAQGLARAVDSALAQSYPHIAVVISDNASSDATARVCEAYAAADPRVTYLRHPVNRGATQNFIAAFEHAEAELFMWLADDDWLDEGYVSRCAEALRADPDLVLAGGRGKYYDEGSYRHDGTAMDCSAARPVSRVLQYYRQVDDNAIFYGVMRMAAARRIPLLNCLGSDWLFAAALAYQGKVKTVDGVCIHRALGGASQSLRGMARALSLPAWQGRVPATLTLAAYAARDIWSCDVYADMPAWRRGAFGLLVSFWMCAIKPVQELRRRLRARAAAPAAPF